MDSYLIGHIEQPSPKLINKKLLEVNVAAKKGKVLMDTSIDETSGFKSDLTPRDRLINQGYMAGFASRNLTNAKPTDSLTIKAVDQSIIKSIATKNSGGNSMGSKPSSQRSIISLKKIHSTSIEGGSSQVSKPPIGEAGKKSGGPKETNRT
jgi:hypothetical protein